MTLTINQSPYSSQPSAASVSPSSPSSNFLQNPSQEAFVIKVCKFLLNCLFSPFIFIYRLLNPAEQKPLILIQKKEVTLLERIAPLASYQAITASPKSVKVVMMGIVGLVGGYVYHQYCSKDIPLAPLRPSLDLTVFAIPALTIAGVVGLYLYKKSNRALEVDTRAQLPNEMQIQQVKDSFQKQIEPYLLDILAKCGFSVKTELSDTVKTLIINDVKQKLNDRIASIDSIDGFFNKTFREQREKLFEDLYESIHKILNKLDENTFWDITFKVIVTQLEQKILHKFYVLVHDKIDKGSPEDKEELKNAFNIFCDVCNKSGLLFNEEVWPEKDRCKEFFSSRSLKDQYYTLWDKLTKHIEQVSTKLQSGDKKVTQAFELDGKDKETYKKHHPQLKVFIDEAVPALNNCILKSICFKFI